MKHLIYSTKDYFESARLAGTDVVAICNSAFVPSYASNGELACQKCSRIVENYPANDRKRKRLMVSDGRP